MGRCAQRRAGDEGIERDDLAVDARVRSTNLAEGTVPVLHTEDPTLLDVLGPWPLRIVWMVLIGSGIFALLTLPALRRTGSAA